MLLTMRAFTQAARAICYSAAMAIDRSERSADDAARKAAHQQASLLTPVAKAFSTDIANDVASLGVQVHGGMGFIEETGAAQHLRDARITPIYEGTNGIQSIDLVSRKLTAHGGASAFALIAEMTDIVARVERSNDPAFGLAAVRLREALGALERASRWLLERITSKPNDALAGATPYLRLFGSAIGGCLLADQALAANTSERGGKRPTALARFFAENVAVHATALERSVTDSADTVNAAEAVLLP